MIEVELVPEGAIYRLLQGPELTFHHVEQEVTLTQERSEMMCNYTCTPSNDDSG